MMHVYCMDEDGDEYWMAHSDIEAAQQYAVCYGQEPDVCEQVSEEAMDSLIITETDEDERPTGNKYTFREYLTMREREGVAKAELFASSL